MTITYTLNKTQIEALKNITDEVNKNSDTVVAPEVYLNDRITDILTSYQRLVIERRAINNKELISAALALPKSTRDEITDFINSKLSTQNDGVGVGPLPDQP